MYPIEYKIINLCNSVKNDRYHDITIEFLTSIEANYFHYRSKLYRNTLEDINDLILKTENMLGFINPVFKTDIEILCSLLGLLLKWKSDTEDNNTQFEVM